MTPTRVRTPADDRPDRDLRRAGGGVTTVEVPPAAAGQRLDNFLQGRLRHLPRSLIYRLVRTGQVRVNGGRAKPLTRLKAGDQVRLPPAPGGERGAPRRVPPGLVATLQAAIVQRDARQVVIDKPAGLAVHSGSGLDFGAIDALREMFPGRDVQLAHRLDRATSGLLLVTLDREALRTQHRALAAGRIGKYYLALLHGRLPEDKVTVDLPLGRDVAERRERRMAVSSDGKPARTEFRRLLDVVGYTLVECRILSGRTHQIRAHAAHLGLPLAGDERYAPEAALAGDRALGLHRLFLHAHRLDLDWPEPCTLSSPLPAELAAFVERLERRDHAC